MKRIVLAGLFVLLLALGTWLGLKSFQAEWVGVDESVVERFAKQADRPPRDPLINTDQGDLLLFVFLVAGAVGGFIGGYFFRELFPARSGERDRELRV